MTTVIIMLALIGIGALIHSEVLFYVGVGGMAAIAVARLFNGEENP